MREQLIKFEKLFYLTVRLTNVGIDLFFTHPKNQEKLNRLNTKMDIIETELNAL